MKDAEIDFFILGAGANVVISDQGLDFVINTIYLNKSTLKGSSIISYSGILMNNLVLEAFNNNLKGLQDFYYMPGTLGGAIYMNAKVYDSDISKCLKKVEFINLNTLEIITKVYTQEEKNTDFAYKSSEFQSNDKFIINAEFKLEHILDQDEKNDIHEHMLKIKEARKEKGHFDFPCAGSVFKNNRDYNISSGQIIDNAGFKGLNVGGAYVYDKHANIIINKNNASSQDIYDLTKLIKSRIKKEYDYDLEPEIQFIGQFEDNE